ncbi:MAG: hypothetical protein Q4G70_10425 [Pseudomonadota bacterium]|nr:hypothetical protein [Pseudomonadota bacterium]
MNIESIDVLKITTTLAISPLTSPRHCGEGRNPWSVTLTRRSPADTVWIAAFAAMTG